MCRPWMVTLVAAVLVLAGCGSANSIIGKWSDPQGGTIEFLDSGIVLAAAKGVQLNITGKWEKVDATRIKIVFDGLLGIAGPQVCSFALAGDTLNFSGCALQGTMKRVR